MQRILFLIKNYADNPEIFKEYLKLFNKSNFETEVFDIAKAHSAGRGIKYVVSVLKAIIKFKPDFIYVADEFFSKNVLFATFAKKILFQKCRIITFIATQYMPKNKNGFLNRAKLNFLLNNIDALFCRNKKELKKLKETDLLKNYGNLYQIYLGVPERFFYKIDQPKETICNFLEVLRKNYPKIKDKHVLGFLGRIVPEKGLDILLECLKKLPGEFVLIYGGRAGNSNYFDKIQNFIAKNNLGERAVYLGQIKGPDLKYVYNICDLMVMPTTQKHNNFSELFGSVIPESMLSKTLIAGSDNGSIPEVIGRKDMIFKQDDSEDLLRIINYCHDLSPEEKEKILNENYSFAAKEYSAETFVGSIIKHISDEK